MSSGKIEKKTDLLEGTSNWIGQLADETFQVEIDDWERIALVIGRALTAT
jgi:hypothetical protein